MVNAGEYRHEGGGAVALVLAKEFGRKGGFRHGNRPSQSPELPETQSRSSVLLKPQRILDGLDGVDKKQASASTEDTGSMGS